MTIRLYETVVHSCKTEFLSMNNHKRDKYCVEVLKSLLHQFQNYFYRIVLRGLNSEVEVKFVDVQLSGTE
jgi:hypothetical protein